MRVYLSGGMEYATDEGRNWRDELERWLTVHLHSEVFNPNRESDRFFAARYPSIDFRALKRSDITRYQHIAAQLVDIDCREIADRTDIVICYWDDAAMRGAGTKGELTIARHSGKPVYMVTSLSPADIPGWILGCVTQRFATFDQLKTHLLTHHSPPPVL